MPKDSPAGARVTGARPAAAADGLRDARLARVGRGLCFAGALLGAVGILGWIFDAPALRIIVPGQPEMKGNTALALILLGLAGSLRGRTGTSRALRVVTGAAALVVLSLSLATLAEYALQIDLGIDQLLFADGEPFPGRPSPPTVLALGLLAAALLVPDIRRAPRTEPTEWLVLAGGFVAFVPLLGFVFGAGELYRYSSASVTGVAVPTAVALLLIATGLLCLRPTGRVTSRVLSPGPGGVLLRRFVPAILLAPTLFRGAITWLLTGLGVREPSLIDAAMAALITVLGLFLLFVTAARLDHTSESLVSSREELRLAEERIAFALQGADLASWDWDVPSGKIVLNSRWAELRGFRPEEIRPHVDSFISGIHPEDLPRVQQALDDYFAGRVATYEVEFRARTKSGRWIWILDRGKVFTRDERGRPVRMVGTELDITPRKRAEEELRLANERVSLALRGGDLAAWDWDIPSGKVVYDPRWAEMRGFRPEEIRPHVDSWISNLHPEDRPRVLKAMDDYHQGRVPDYEAEFRAQTASGQWIWVLGRGRVFARDDRGRPLRMAGTELDITPRKQAEEKLRLAEAKSSGILAISADAIISIDDKQRITMFNDGAEQIFGYARDEVLGAPLDILIPESVGAAHHRHVAAFATGEDTASRMGERVASIRGLRKNGEEFPADATISKLDVGGSLILTVSLRDMTAQRKLEEGLRRAVQARDSVMGIVAHDLRNPLSAILMEAELLRTGKIDHGRRSGTPAEAIARSARRMNRLIQDLLDVTVMEHGRLSVEQAGLRTQQLLSEALDAQRALAAAASLALELDLAPDVPAVWADHDRMLQVFENLIGNAAKFTEAGGRITVGAAPRDDEVLFWVADTGSGIRDEDLPHLFDPFWQGRSHEAQGAGLGLPIVKGIVEAHEGRIWVESAPDEGTTFFFTIPTPRDSGARQPAPVAA